MDYANPHDDAEILRSSMKGKTKNEDKIIKIITNRTNEQRQQIKTEYNKLYNSDLIKDLQKELSGHSIYFYLLPMEKLDENREQILKEVVG